MHFYSVLKRILFSTQRKMKILYQASKHFKNTSECICSSLGCVCQESPELPEEGRCLILTRTFEDLRLLLTFFTCSDSIKTKVKKKKLAVHKKPLGEHVINRAKEICFVLRAECRVLLPVLTLCV